MTEKNNNPSIDENLEILNSGPDWVREHRMKECEKFNSSPLPHRRINLWRYTNPVDFIPTRIEKTTKTRVKFEQVLSEQTTLLNEGSLSGLVADIGGNEIQVVGVSNKMLQQGVLISSLNEAIKSHEALIKKYLYKIINSDTGKLEAHNGALWNDGIVIYVPKNVTVEHPIHLLRESHGAGTTQYPRLLVIVDENSELTLVDEHIGGAKENDKLRSHTNASVEIFSLQNSRTRYVSLQKMNSGANFYLTHRTQADKDANIITAPFSFGAILSKQNFGVILNGQGANSDIYGLNFGSNYQHSDIHTMHHHAAGNTTSSIDFKVVLQDQSLSAYTGLIRIDKESPACQAYQENKNLLLSSKAKAESIPELEILNEDVSCSHGATMGPVDPQMLFYLTCRGINPEVATRMIISGFVASTLDKIPYDLRDRINKEVDERLNRV